MNSHFNGHNKNKTKYPFEDDQVVKFKVKKNY